ncbi:MAG TPA: serine hydrolase domain-containing protein, partial [Gaiellales bacterium]|nr:serine hydrolase domain-containing protein [Gaiellales bacterium]
MLVSAPRASAVRTFDEQAVDGWVDSLLSRHPAVGMAVGVVRDGELAFFRGHGVANAATGARITEDTVFRIASITKTFTAIALMQLWESGLVDLDAPANEYLRAFQLVGTKRTFRPVTLRHLLTHTSGLPEMVHPLHSLAYMYGESFALDDRVPTLREYYRGGLKVASDPGSIFRYTDHNFAVVGQVVEDVSGEPFEEYLRGHVFQPLGMSATDIERTEVIASRLATGYDITARGPRPVTDRVWLTAAASMIYSSPRDMARYVAALLGQGANSHGRVLKPETLKIMFAPHFQPDPRVPGLGIAFDRADLRSHAAVGHGGILPGFNSQIFAAVDDGTGVIAFTNGARGAMLWLPAEIVRLLGRVIGVPDDGIRDDVPQHPEIWGELCGWYPLDAPLTDTRIRVMLGAGARVFVHGGRLTLRVLNPTPAALMRFELHPDDPKDPYIFRIDLSA